MIITSLLTIYCGDKHKLSKISLTLLTVSEHWYWHQTAGCKEHNAHTNSDMGTLLLFIHQPVVDDERIRPGQVKVKVKD